MFRLAVILFLLIGCGSRQMPQREASPIKAECNIKRVTNELIPYVQSKDSRVESLYFCWGLIHATDRTWQMDYFRRVAQGRTAEIFGYSKLKNDFGMRVLGIYEHAEKIYSELSKESKSILWAYADGVNAAFAKAQYDQIYEFNELQYKPEAWHPVDSISLLLIQSLDQTRKTFSYEFKQEEELKKAYKTSAIDHLTEDDLPWFTSILKEDDFKKNQAEEVSKISTLSVNNRSSPHSNLIVAQADWLDFLPTDIGAGGSNNWVLAPSKTQNRKAILANDPHLNIRNPPFWHWSNINQTVMGAGFAGLPIVISGFSHHLAWGLTNSYYDSGEVFHVREDEMLNAKSFYPLIWIKFGPIQLPFMFKKARTTEYHQPVLPLDAPSGYALVLNWNGFKINGSDIDHLFRLNHSKNAREMLATLKKIKIPSWNFVFADLDGNIGFYATGHLNRLDREKYKVGVDSVRLSTTATTPTLSEDENPMLLNPKRGFIATANQQHWPNQMLPFGGTAYAKSFRAHRIEQLLRMKMQNIETTKNIQCDIIANDAPFLLPQLIPLILDKAELNDSKVIQAVQLLKEWDYQTHPSCRACGIYRRWIDLLMENLYTNEIGIYRLALAKNEQLKKLLYPKLQQTISDISKVQSENFPEWRHLHRLFFRHASEDSRFYKNEYISTAGDDHSISPANANWKETFYEQYNGASQRLIVELSNPPKAYYRLGGSNLAEESPNLKNPQGPWMKWATCQYDEMELSLSPTTPVVSEVVFSN